MVSQEVDKATPLQGPEIDRLWEGFPQDLPLTPSCLTKVQQQYDRFTSLEFFDPNLWVDVHSSHLASQSREGWEKGFFLLSGPPAMGKDTILSTMDSWFAGQISIICTSTTRPRRTEDAVGEKYLLHLSQEEFEHHLQEGDFIEHVPLDGQNLYGTPKFTVAKALKGDERLIMWRGEPMGAMEMRRYMSEHHPQIPTAWVFIFPYQMSLDGLLERIAARRPASEVEERFRRAKREIYLGAHADFLLMNPPEKSGFPSRACEAMEALVRNVVGVEKSELSG